MHVNEAVILAGGLGTRLRSVISDKPKVMAEVCGAPFLSWIIKAIKNDGVNRVILCVGYLSEQVEDYFNEEFQGVEIVYSKEDKPLGTGGAIVNAVNNIKSENIFILNGDSWCVTNLRKFSSDYFNRSAQASVVLAKVPDSGRYGSVEFDADNKLTSFREKNPEGLPGWINAGIYLVNKSLLHRIPSPNRNISLEKEVLPMWVKEGMYGFPSEGSFIDIGTPESFLLAEEFVLGLR